MRDPSGLELAAWAAMEAEHEARVGALVEHMEHAGLHEMALRVHADRLREFERAEENLARAIARARVARDELAEATALVEDTCKLMVR